MGVLRRAGKRERLLAVMCLLTVVQGGWTYTGEGVGEGLGGGGF